MLALGPPSGFHAVTDDGGEGTDREVLVGIESEDRRAVRAVAVDRVGDNRHRVRLTQRTADGESAAFTRLIEFSSRERLASGQSHIAAAQQVCLV